MKQSTLFVMWMVVGSFLGCTSSTMDPGGDDDGSGSDGDTDADSDSDVDSDTDTDWYDGSGCTSATLSFDHYYHDHDSYDYARVLMTNDEVEWVTLTTYTSTTDGHVELDLHTEQWTGTEVRIEFQYEG